MLMFNDAISKLGLVELPLIGLVELPLKGRNYTWSNMQRDPLLENLDWVFTSSSWTISYPSSFVYPLSKPISDHVPCVVTIETKIPKTQVFRYENFWMHPSEFKNIVQVAWQIPVEHSDSVKIINGKLKNVRIGLKLWAKNLPCLKKS
jgi:hypothetical protein